MPSAITLRSPSDELLRRIGRRLHLHDVLFGEVLVIFPADVAHHLEGRGQDGAAVAGMRLDDLALPFGIEQVLEARRRVLGLHQPGVVGDRAQRGAEAGIGAVGIAVLGLVMLRDVFRHVGQQEALPFPRQQMRGVGRIGDIDGVDVAGIFLADALEHPLGAGALDPHLDAAEFLLERGGDLFRHRQVDRGVPDHLAFLLRRFDQLRRDGFGRRRLGAGGRGEHGSERQRGRDALSALWRTSRLESLRFFIASSCLLLSAQRPAAFGRQREPDLGAPGNRGFPSPSPRARCVPSDVSTM